MTEFLLRTFLFLFFKAKKPGLVCVYILYMQFYSLFTGDFVFGVDFADDWIGFLVATPSFSLLTSAFSMWVSSCSPPL